MLSIRRFVHIGLLAGALYGAPILAQQADPLAAPAAVAPAAIEYETIEIPDTIVRDGKMTDAMIKIDRLVKEIYNGSQQLAPNQANFDNYFTRYYFPMWTQLDDKSLARLPKDRTKFFREHIQAAKNKPNVHEHLVKLTYENMKALVTKNYHPAVRYHAMLVIGDLNSREPVFSGSAALPLPFSDALDFMITEVRNPKQIDAVRVAALLGILRHCDMNAHSTQQYPPAVRQGIIKQIAPIAMDKKVPAERSPEGHAWVRARAFEILGALGQAGYDAPLVKALVNVVSDEKESLDVRFAAATSLGRINYGALPETPGEEIARKLADLASFAAKQQLAALDAEIAAERERIRRESGGGGNFGEYRPTIAGQEFAPGSIVPIKIVKVEQRLTLTQRMLKDRMIKVRFGLEGEGQGGAGSAAKGAAKQYVTNVRDAVIALMKVGDLKDRNQGVPKIADLAKEMRLKIADLDRVAKTGGAPAPAEEPAPPAVTESPDEDPLAEPGPMKKKAATTEGPDEGPDEVPAPIDAPPMPKKGAAAPGEEGPEAP